MTDESASTRRCIVTGETCERTELVRFVVSPEGEVVPDLEERLPGRGLWVKATREAIEAGAQRGAFSRAAKTAAQAPADLADRVEGLLAQRCCSLLGLAKRAGETVNGYEKVAALVRSGRAAVWVVASDAAEGTRDKISVRPPVVVVDALNRRELSLALGGENVVHAALTAGGLARRFLNDVARLVGMRGSRPTTRTPPAAVAHS